MPASGQPDRTDLATARASPGRPCQRSVRDVSLHVKEPSTPRPGPSSPDRPDLCTASVHRPPLVVVLTSEGVTDMADLAYILLTVAFFATVALLARRAGDRDAS